MDQIPFSFDYPAFGLILIITFIFCMVASWWPTKVVTTLNPAVALGYE
jgi:ABC-type antimicrobial peptide transport system permease subunit